VVFVLAGIYPETTYHDTLAIQTSVFASWTAVLCATSTNTSSVFWSKADFHKHSPTTQHVLRLETHILRQWGRPARNPSNSLKHCCRHLPSPSRLGLLEYRRSPAGCHLCF